MFNDRCVLLLMIVAKITGQNATEVRLIENDDVVKTLTTD